jgi:hypothetical protein
MCSQLAWIETLVRRKFEKTFDTLHHAVVYRCADPRGPVRLAELGHAAYRAPVCLPATSSERGETARLVTKAPVTPLLHATRWGVRAALTLPRAKQERESASGVVRRPSRRVGLKRSL